MSALGQKRTCAAQNVMSALCQHQRLKQKDGPTIQAASSVILVTLGFFAPV